MTCHVMDDPSLLLERLRRSVQAAPPLCGHWPTPPSI